MSIHVDNEISTTGNSENIEESLISIIIINEGENNI